MRSFILLTFVLISFFEGITLVVEGADKPRTHNLFEDIRVVGDVVDSSNNLPLAEASVLVKNSLVGTTTDSKGHFEIVVPRGSVLVVSFTGYKSKEVVAENTKPLVIALAAAEKGLEEVVVVGYQTMKKKDLTGAISTVKADELVMASAPDIGHMLEGKIPGMFIQQNSAQPGGGLNLLIRGGGSINASNAPLIVVDGFPVSETQQPQVVVDADNSNPGTFSVFNSINPNDVESITVLKDASATAIYGSRAANGVIIITTKRGKSGRPTLNYSGNYTVQPYVNKLKMLDLGQWMQVFNEGAYENFLWENGVQPWGTNTLAEAAANPVGTAYHPFFSQRAIDNVGPGTDWLGLVTRTGTTDQHNLSVSGGSEGVKYLLSGSYYDQKGIVKNSDMKRISLRSNVDIKLNKILTLSTSVSTSRIDNHNSQLGDEQFEKQGILTAALVEGPQIRARGEDGSYPVNPTVAIQPNPLSLLTIFDKGLAENSLFNGSLIIKPDSHWNINLKGGYERGVGKRWGYVPRTVIRGLQRNGIADYSETVNEHYLMQATANYNNRFGEKNSLDVLIGASKENFINQSNGSNVSNFITDAFLMYNMGAGTGTKTISSGRSEDEIGSFFGRLNYIYNDKYFVTFSMRADGTSVFAKGHQWGYFPSVALAWDMVKEPFFKNISSKINQFKFRVSYGQVGNASIGTNAFASYFAHPAYLSGDDQIQIAISPDRLANPDLTWETTKEFNVGLDFSILKSRISGSLDFYNKIISNLLDTKPLDSYQPISSVIANIGSTRSKGFELLITSANIKTKDFSWDTRLSLSRFYNTWNKRADDWKPAVYQKEHDPINAMFYQLSGGIMQIENKVPGAEPELKPGQIIIQDINGFVRDASGNPVVNANGRFQLTGKPDGIIDDADYKMIGNGDPSLIGGIVNILHYKNFTLNISFNAMFGRRIADPNLLQFGLSAYNVFQDGVNSLTTVFDRWTPDHPSTVWPSTYAGWSNYGEGDFFLQKAWFIRLQDISLQYDFPQEWYRGVFDRISVNVAAHNLFWISPYTGVDPETDSYAAAYPNMSTFNFGLSLQF